MQKNNIRVDFTDIPNISGPRGVVCDRCPQCGKLHFSPFVAFQLGRENPICCSCGYKDVYLTDEQFAEWKKKQPSYSIEYFKRHGIYKSKTEPTGDFELKDSAGRNRSDELSPPLRKRLETAGGGRFDNPSREDQSVICAMLAAGLTADDACATFMQSARGSDVQARKSNAVDYLARTMRYAVGWHGGAQKETGKITADFSRPRKVRIVGEIVEQSANDIEPEKTTWLWPSYIPAGKITIIAGDPGLGKSTLTADLTARISRGREMPENDKRFHVGTCGILSAEDEPATTIVPRLIAAAADLHRIKILRKVKIEGEDEERYLAYPRDLDRIRNYIRARGLRILIIDPMNAFLDREVDSYRDQDIRSVLAPLDDVAERTGCAIVLIYHYTKNSDRADLYRVSGAIGIVGAARSVLGVKRLDNSEDCVMYPVKSNLSRKPPALRFDILQRTEYEVGRIEWKGKCADPTRSQDATPQMEKESLAFLRQEFGDGGEIESDTVKRDANAAGISWRTLCYYKHKLGAQSEKRGGRWFWKFDESKRAK